MMSRGDGDAQLQMESEQMNRLMVAFPVGLASVVAMIQFQHIWVPRIKAIPAKCNHVSYLSRTLGYSRSLMLFHFILLID